MVEFEYTDHAEEQLVQRKLDKRLIESVILVADKVTESRFSRKIARRKVEDCCVWFTRNGEQGLMRNSFLPKAG